MTRTKAYKRKGKLQLPQSLKPKEYAEPPSLEALGVDTEQCRKAIHALVKHLGKQKASQEQNELISRDEHLFLVVTLKEMYAREKTMPIRLSVPHPLADPKRFPVCLFVKDPQREYKDLLQEKNIGFISRVIGVEKLKGKFKPFEARRQLMDTYETFLADDRIIPMLPKLLGKQWITRRKQPLPVSLKRKDLKAELERILSATSLFINTGTCTTIRIGTPMERHTEAELLDNLLQVIPQLAVRLPGGQGGWANVQALHVKISSSLSLPIWNCDLGEGGETARFKEPTIANGEHLAIEDSVDLVNELDTDASEAEEPPAINKKRKRTGTDAVISADATTPPKKVKLSSKRDGAKPKSKLTQDVPTQKTSKSPKSKASNR